MDDDLRYCVECGVVVLPGEEHGDVVCDECADLMYERATDSFNARHGLT